MDLKSELEKNLARLNELQVYCDYLRDALRHLFPIELYRNNRPDLVDYSDCDLIEHFVKLGINEPIAEIISNRARTAQLERSEIMEANQVLLLAERDQLSASLNQLIAQVQDKNITTLLNIPANVSCEFDENIGLLSIHLGPGKYSSDKWESYFKHYDRNLTGFRGRPNQIKLLEIGVQNGGSLEAWKRYLGPNARVIGTDIDPATGLLELPDQISCFVGNATDPTWADKLCSKHGPFDIVIDDGSHVNNDIIKSFFLFFPSIKQGGVYVCEDLHTAYWEHYGGCAPKSGPNAIELFKEVADLVNLEHWQGLPGFRLSDSIPLFISAMEKHPTFTMRDLLSIETIEFCNSMVFVRRSPAGPVSLGQRLISNRDAEVEPANLKLSGKRM